MSSLEQSKAYKNRALIFLALTFTIISAILYFSLSRAKITVIPLKEKVVIDSMVEIKKEEPLNLETPETLTGQLFETELKEIKEFASSGRKTQEAKAEGEVVIINNYTKNQPLVATTRLLSSQGILFRTKHNVLARAGEEVKVAVQADQVGDKGNISPTRFRIPGLWPGLQDKIYGESKETMNGGVKEVKFVTAQDIEKAQEEMEKLLIRKALEKLGPQASADGLVQELEILETQANKEIGEEAEKFSLKTKAKIKKVQFNQETLLSLAKAKLKEKISERTRLVEIDEETFSYSLKEFDLKNGTSKLMTHLEGKTTLKEEDELLDKSKLVGLNKDEVKGYLESLKGIKEVKVEFWPFWTRKVPRLKDHIEIVILPSKE